MTPGPTPDHTFIEFVHARRGAVGGVFLALAVGCLALAGYCGYRGFRDAARPAPDLTQPAPAPTPDDADPPELEPRPFQVGAAASLLGALALGGVGAFFVGQLPDPDPAVRRRRDRLLLLAAGYLFGLACRAVGLFLFVFWFGHLTDWVNGVAGSNKTGWQPIAALLLFLIGAGVTFLATIPARAEERHHPFLRRAVYAVNFALSAVLLVVGLVLANAVVAMKAPDALDTTATGFYTLTPQTAEYLRGLSQPVKVIAVAPVGGSNRDSRVVADALRLIAVMREVNPQRFETEQLSVVYDKAKLDALERKYPAAGVGRVGLLVATGTDFERAEFLPFAQMQDPERGAFVGEAELYRTLRGLIDKRTTAYFTQASREPLLDRPTDPAKAAAARTATRLKELLEKSRCTAKPLDIDPLASDPKVPDDADLVVVLDPLAPLPPATVSAIQRYAGPADPKARRGKLVVFTPARAGASGGLLQTGLEQFLGDFGIAVTDRAVYSRPTEKVGADWTNLIVPPQEVQRGSPIALAADGVDARNPRCVALLGEGGRGPAGTARPVLFSGGQNWLEKGVFDPPAKAWQDLEAAAKRGDRKYQLERSVTADPLPIGAVASDPTGKPAVAVFGVGEGLADDAPGGGQLDRLLAASVDWLSERPAAPDISPKEYVAYVPKRGLSVHLLLTVPVAGTLLFIVLLGLGVWAIRRK